MSKTVQLLNNQRVFTEKCYVAESFLDRLMGLMGRSRISPEEGMLFPNCGSVHTWFMRFPIDVIFLKGGDAELRVLDVHPSVTPFRLFPLWNTQATHTLELPGGQAEAFGLKKGDELQCLSL